jgi:murein DD-endopeptidase MepM/ murein hydrolase activator NlpD
MRNINSWLLLVVFLFLPLTACNAVNRVNPLPDQDNLEITAILPTNTVTRTEKFPDTTPTTALHDVEETPEAPYPISCEESFCQIDWPGWMRRPFSEPNRDWIDLTYPYASTGDGTLAIHNGVEFPNQYGTPVQAAAAGEVIFAGDDEELLLGPYTNFYGNVIILKHENLYEDKDLFTLYGHLSNINVEEGDSVQAGDVLGQVGATGVASGSHLHFEVRYDVNKYQNSTNPVLWFSPLINQASGQAAILAGLIVDSYGEVVPEVSLTLEKLSDEGEIEGHYYFKTYAENGINSHPALDENFALPDLPPGDYRFTYISGKMYEIFFTLEPGKLGFINLQGN